MYHPFSGITHACCGAGVKGNSQGQQVTHFPSLSQQTVPVDCPKFIGETFD